VRVCLVYDCLYPYTIGGAERWYRNLAERLAARGHEVTFLTRRQWDSDDEVDVPGVRVIAVSPRTELYSRGRRRLVPPLRFGLGVWRHLRRHGNRYDVVHTASFPYFSLLGAAAARRRSDFRLVVDWHEVWTRRYWREYLGTVGGELGWWIPAINQLGSYLFLVSALAAYINPETDSVVNEAIANWGTLTGALCFAAGGVLQGFERPD